MERRGFLALAVSTFASASFGCGGGPKKPVSPPPPQPPKPLDVASLETLLPLAGLRWLVLAQPKELAAIAWLAPALAMVLDPERLDRAAVATGYDLRSVPEVMWAAYRTDREEDCSVEILRHQTDSLKIERLFRDRLTSDMTRSIDDPRIVRASGRIGQTVHAFASIGQQIVCFQQEGSADRGPCRVSTLLALGRLKRTLAVFDDEALRELAKRLGSAPLRAFAPGPFEGDLARGARGLLAAATAVGATLRPTERESVLFEIAMAGDFSRSGEQASQKLLASWDDVAARSLGHLLGLDAPRSAPLPTYTSDALSLVVELDPQKLAKGLADATRNQIRDIMR